jgi:phytoene/squalene synthetase
MPKKTKTDREEKESLVPSISQEEDRLQNYLDAARQEARQIIQKAQQDAAEKEKRAQEELPAFMEKERAGFLAASQARAETLRAELSIETEKTLKKAEANTRKAAAIVVHAVWPGGEG